MESPSEESKKEWLVNNGFTLEFEKRLETDPDSSLVAPQNVHKMIALLEKAVARSIIVPPLLLAIDDWSLYLKTEMDMVMRLRASANERRSLIADITSSTKVRHAWLSACSH
jgi:hypothetical protein